MAKNKKKGTTALNPPFDHRMTSIGAPHNGSASGPLRRGWLATDNTTNPTVPGRVNFLFNPPQVTVSHPLNTSFASAAYRQSLSDAESGGQAEWVANTLGQAGEVGVSLLFDRTYELWDKSYKGTLAGDYGAYVDVLAFYKLLGIVDSSAAAPMVGPVAPGANRPDIVNFGLFPQNPLTGSPICYLYLGPNSLKFRGFVDNFNVTYTHFSKQMVPMRVQIDLSMQMYFAATHSTQSGGGSVTLPGSPDGPGQPLPNVGPPLKPLNPGTGTSGPNPTWTDPNTGITWTFPPHGPARPVTP